MKVLKPETVAVFTAELDVLLGDLERTFPGEAAAPIDDTESRSAVFRLLHSIKSMAGLGGIAGMEHEAHELEDLLIQGQAEEFTQRLARFVTDSRQIMGDLSLGGFQGINPPQRARDESEAALLQVQVFDHWHLEPGRIEQVWEQIDRGKDLWLLSAWIQCPGESALTRAGLLLAKLEDDFWILDSRVWGGAQSPGPYCLRHGGANSLSHLDSLFFQAIAVIPGIKKGDFSQAIPDQVPFWFASRMDRDFYALRSHQLRYEEGALFFARLNWARHMGNERTAPNPQLLDLCLRWACQGSARADQPFSGLLRTALEALMAQTGEQVDARLSVDEVPLPARAQSLLLEVAVHLLRNVLAHCTESAESRKSQFKPEIPLVHVHVQRDQDQICLYVADDGPGIEIQNPDADIVPGLDFAVMPEQRKFSLSRQFGAALWGPDIFPLLGQTERKAPATIDMVSGRGIGLPSCAFIVNNLLQGSISCRSRRDTGTCFEVSVPRILIQASCALFEWDDEWIAIPVALLLCNDQGPLMVDFEGNGESISWAGKSRLVVNPLSRLELQEHDAKAVFNMDASCARWVGRFKGIETCIFPRDANSFYSLSAARWVVLEDF